LTGSDMITTVQAIVDSANSASSEKMLRPVRRSGANRGDR